MWRDHLNKDLLEIVLGVLLPELIERAFSEELTGLDDADGIAELFDFAHNMSGEDDGLAVVAAFADKSGDGAGGHDIKTERGLIEDHDRGVVDERAGYGSFLLHARGQFVAGSVAENVLDRKSTRLTSSRQIVSYVV